MAARPVYGATRYLGAQKQNNGIDCNFFAIGNRCGFSNRGYGRESAANRPPNDLFHYSMRGRELLIEKKLQKS